MTKQSKPNRLINEKSPYLLQHAHNPVNWYPWGDDAFSKAKAEDKPIFLSIGYSTCHWCHVMERESFEDDEVAGLLNENFIAIKVDREERPDIDTIYMSVCQAMTGSGGWPLTVIMSPDKKPFFAGTYFPKKSRMGMPGLMDVLGQVGHLWKTERQKLLDSSEEIAKHIELSFFSHQASEVKLDVLDRAYAYFSQTFDAKYGGFGSAPKFPTPHNLMFLLRYWRMTGKASALDMVEKTIEAMYRGGIYDHIGFGFARYSTDRQWLVPHFEKMLYDNALLAIASLETYQATGKPLFARIAREIFTYVLRDMTSPEGAFYSAEDADSEGEEGKFYLWSPEEVREVLGAEKAKEYCCMYDITERGNFEGKSIPNLIHNNSMPEMDAERQKLFTKREERIHPFKDDKILTAWNGLIIAAMAFGARVLNEKTYAEAAEKAVDFVMQNLRGDDGRLLARYRDGEASFLAYADDYAFLVWGLVELYEATFKPKYLRKALELNRDMLKYFWDQIQGGLYQYGWDAEQLITRPKEIYDGAIPSGNSVAALNLLRLAKLTGDGKIEETAQAQLKTFGGTVNDSPVGHGYFLMAVFFNETPVTEITIVGDLQNQDTRKMLEIVNNGFKPEQIVIVKSSDVIGKELLEMIPALVDKENINGDTIAYVCKSNSCRPPVTNWKKLEKILSGELLSI